MAVYISSIVLSMGWSVAQRPQPRRSRLTPSAMRDDLPERRSLASAPDMASKAALAPIQRSGSGSHLRRRRSTQGRRVSGESTPAIRSASVRPARFDVPRPSPTYPPGQRRDRSPGRTPPRPTSRGRRRADRPSGG